MLASPQFHHRHDFGSGYAMLRRYLGDVKFTSFIREFTGSHPAERANARWISQHLADYAATYAPFKPFPEIYELAIFERAFNFAFETIDTKTLTRAELENIYANFETIRQINLHPSASLLTFTQNTTSIWSALKCEEQPPRPHGLDGNQKVAVWRQNGLSRFRLLGSEEAQIFDQARSGASFKAISKTIRGSDTKDVANGRAVNYLRGWFEAELILAPNQNKEL